MNGSVGFPNNPIAKSVPICRPRTEPLTFSHENYFRARQGLGRTSVRRTMPARIVFRGLVNGSQIWLTESGSNQLPNLPNPKGHILTTHWQMA